MLKLKKMFFIIMTVAFIFGAIGCSEEGPAEKAGKEVDKTIEKAKKAFD